MRKLLGHILHRKRILDSNIILRFLLNDNVLLAEEAKSIITTYKCIAYLEVIEEVVYVLHSPHVYGIPRNEIANQLKQLSKEITIDKQDVLYEALDAFSEKPKLDFVDCLLYGYHRNGYNVETFDRKLRRKFH